MLPEGGPAALRLRPAPSPPAAPPEPFCAPAWSRAFAPRLLLQLPLLLLAVLLLLLLLLLLLAPLPPLWPPKLVPRKEG